MRFNSLALLAMFLGGCGAHAAGPTAGNSSQASTAAACPNPADVFAARLAAEPDLGQAAGPIIRVGSLTVQPIAGGTFTNLSPAWLVANGASAYVVMKGFFDMYSAPDADGIALSDKLGAPLEDEHSQTPYVGVQLFQYGYLEWNASPPGGEVHYYDPDVSPRVTQAAASALFATRLAADSTLGTAAGAVQKVGSLYVQPISGGSNYTPGDPTLPFVWLVANGEVHQAFVVADGFFRMYSTNNLSDKLGPPLEDAHPESTYPSVQWFAHGELFWHQSPWSGTVQYEDPDGTTCSGRVDSGSADSGALSVDSGSPDSAEACIASTPLDTASWTQSPDLVILGTPTTTQYSCQWLFNGSVWKTYNYTADCEGWISDDFIAGSGEEAIVGWNLLTNAMYTQPSGTNTYNNQVATDCAKWATQTIFPPGDLSQLDIRN